MPQYLSKITVFQPVTKKQVDIENSEIIQAECMADALQQILMEESLELAYGLVVIGFEINEVQGT